jgi:hypothetical protein
MSEVIGAAFDLTSPINGPLYRFRRVDLASPPPPAAISAAPPEALLAGLAQVTAHVDQAPMVPSKLSPPKWNECSFSHFFFIRNAYDFPFQTDPPDVGTSCLVE